MDPEIENEQESWTPYAFGFDNAVRYEDADGRNPFIIGGAIVGGIVGAGLAWYDGKSAKEIAIAGVAGAVGGAIIGSGAAFLAPAAVTGSFGVTTSGISALSLHGAIVNGAAGFVAGAATEGTTQALTGKGFDTHKIAASAVVSAGANIVGGGISALKLIEKGASKIGGVVAARTAQRIAGPQAAGQIRASILRASPMLRNNNKALNAAVGAALRQRQREAVSLGKAIEKPASAALQAGWEKLNQSATDYTTSKLDGSKNKR